MDLVGHLLGQFTGRTEDEGLDGLAGGVDLSIAGMEKAAVFPEPVWDWPTRSPPARRTGIAAD